MKITELLNESFNDDWDKEEDILTNVNYIKSGIVIDKLLQSLIVTPIDYNELLIGDKNAILVAARVLGYGKDYNINYGGKEITIDLSKLEDKIIDESLYKRGINEFPFTLPHSGNNITFKLLTHGDEQKIEAEIKGLQKINPLGKDFGALIGIVVPKGTPPHIVNFYT